MNNRNKMHYNFLSRKEEVKKIWDRKDRKVSESVSKKNKNNKMARK